MDYKDTDTHYLANCQMEARQDDSEVAVPHHRTRPDMAEEALASVLHKTSSTAGKIASSWEAVALAAVVVRRFSLISLFTGTAPWYTVYAYTAPPHICCLISHSTMYTLRSSLENVASLTAMLRKMLVFCSSWEYSTSKLSITVCWMVGTT